MPVSFILIAKHSVDPDSLEQSRASIDRLSGFEKELLYAIPGPKSQSMHDLLNAALAAASGAYVQLLSAGFCIDAAQFQKELALFQSSPGASALVRIPNSAAQPGVIPGQVFVYNCLTNLELPVREPEQILFKRTDNPLSVKEKFDSGMYTDLVFQIARSGDIIVTDAHHFSTPETPSISQDISHLILQNSSFLRCLSCSSHELLEKLAQRNNQNLQVMP